MKINPPMNSNSIQANADALPFANLAKHSCSTQQNEKGDAAQGLRSFFDRSTPKTGHLPVIAALITTLSLLPVAGAEPNPASNLPLRPSDHKVPSAAATEHGAIGDAKTLNAVGSTPSWTTLYSTGSSWVRVSTAVSRLIRLRRDATARGIRASAACWLPRRRE